MGKPFAYAICARSLRFRGISAFEFKSDISLEYILRRSVASSAFRAAQIYRNAEPVRPGPLVSVGLSLVKTNKQWFGITVSAPCSTIALDPDG